MTKSKTKNQIIEIKRNIRFYERKISCFFVGNKGTFKGIFKGTQLIFSKKSLAIFLLFAFNLFSVQGIGGTVSYFSDIEKGGENLLSVGIMDMSLEGKGIDKTKFSKCESVSTEIKVLDEGDIDFIYNVEIDSKGYLCEDLVVEAEYVGEGDEQSFEESLVGFSTDYDFVLGEWEYKIYISKKASNPRGKCDFDFVYNAIEDGANPGVGFWDEERISNTIVSNNPGPDESLNGQLLINEVSMGSKKYYKHDYVEIYNPTDTDIDLGDFANSYIRLVKRGKDGDSDRTLKSWHDSLGQIVPAHGYYLWASSYDVKFPDKIKADAKSKGYIGDNNGVALRVGKYNIGQVIDSVAWGEANNSFIEGDIFPGNPKFGQSLERGLSGFDSDNNKEDFVIKNNPTPTNSLDYGRSNILINEFLAKGDVYNEFVEIYNATTTDIDINDWKVVVENENGTSTKMITASELKAGEWLAISFVGDTLLESSIVTLFDDDDNEIDKIKFKNATTTDKSFARIPDGSPNWVDPVPTPGEANEEDLNVVSPMLVSMELKSFEEEEPTEEEPTEEEPTEEEPVEEEPVEEEPTEEEPTEEEPVEEEPTEEEPTEEEPSEEEPVEEEPTEEEPVEEEPTDEEPTEEEPVEEEPTEEEPTEEEPNEEEPSGEEPTEEEPTEEEPSGEEPDEEEPTEEEPVEEQPVEEEPEEEEPIEEEPEEEEPAEEEPEEEPTEEEPEEEPSEDV